MPLRRDRRAAIGPDRRKAHLPAQQQDRAARRSPWRATKAILDVLPGDQRADAFLFPRYALGRGQLRYAARWRLVYESVGLGRLRLHDLRRTSTSHDVMSAKNPLRLILFDVFVCIKS